MKALTKDGNLSDCYQLVVIPPALYSHWQQCCKIIISTKQPVSTLKTMLDTINNCVYCLLLTLDVDTTQI